MCLLLWILASGGKGGTAPLKKPLGKLVPITGKRLGPGSLHRKKSLRRMSSSLSLFGSEFGSMANLNITSSLSMPLPEEPMSLEDKLDTGKLP